MGHSGFCRPSTPKPKDIAHSIPASWRRTVRAFMLTFMMLITQALLAYTFWNVNATDEWSEWFWRSFRTRRSH